VHTGLKKLREKDDVIKHVEEEADSNIKIANDIPTVIAEDTVSQVMICYWILIS